MEKQIETTLSDWPRELQPKELMFFSLDVVGSTARKQTTVPAGEAIIPDNSEWFKDIQSFYIKSVSIFFDTIKRVKKTDRNVFIKNMKNPRVWKTQGDEVLFWIEITDSRQVLILVEEWKNTIELLRTALRERALDFKSAVWIAHFPWRNKMIFTSGTGARDTNLDGSEDRNLQLAQTYFEQIYGKPPKNAFQLVPDFVGPGVDIGFRLATQATQRRLVISTDVVYMLALGALHMKRSIEHLPIHFEGMHILKGVLGGLEYPLFWIDMIDKKDIYSYSHDLGRRDPCKPELIKEFMGQFYHQRHNYLYEPFVVSPTEPLLKLAPEWYINAHKAMLAAERIDRAAAAGSRKRGSPRPAGSALTL